MTNFLFWNVGQKSIADEIALACHENDVDVLILAECPLPPVLLLLKLNVGASQVYIAPFNASPRLAFFIRYPNSSFRPLLDEGGVAIRQIQPPVGVEVLLVALHLPSKLHRSATEQTLFAVRVADFIRDAEARAGHSNSLVIGDLNMDPYEDGMTAAVGFHGVMDKSIALQLARTVDGEKRNFFYNPMWNRLGDETSGPPGTYYRRGGQISHFWHTFDQVLLRPSLLAYYSSSALRVLTRIGNRDLLASNHIDASVSDHLPVFLGLALEKGI
jgi:hypothetical protein